MRPLPGAEIWHAMQTQFPDRHDIGTALEYDATGGRLRHSIRLAHLSVADDACAMPWGFEARTALDMG